jgi:hypothetical protein
MGPAGKTQHAIRRSTRLPLEVPVLLSGAEAGVAFSVPCNTTLVNAHGCGLIVPRSLPVGTPVRLEIVSAKRSTTARVAELVPLGGDPETWLVGLELDTPGNFWGIEYAPSDWKIEEIVPQPAPSSTAEPKPVVAAKPAAKAETAAAAKVEPAASAPVRSLRWRLTDISGGACYLETTAPFPANTPVLLSIRSQNTECLLDGIVRVSHEHGIGIEFTGPQKRDRRVRVEELIERLMSNREVPKIFVGRKEGQLAAAAMLETAAATEDTHDPLLELIRGGAALSADQFLSDLRAQRESGS